jgi:hypothetical protein
MSSGKVDLNKLDKKAVFCLTAALRGVGIHVAVRAEPLPSSASSAIGCIGVVGSVLFRTDPLKGGRVMRKGGHLSLAFGQQQVISHVEYDMTGLFWGEEIL